ncbi:unnamed protein product [Cyprideis torosa]|uniref:Uncharacterized protein n=1 Tax=Cyprideis torosa TaxID=163714 RepID=A0A7R8W2S5_9CRUS|nr:unnamed protein product [Cyprideis torosa]CAG0882271.1 unnamed protein product [Cyprideis torosa]
MTAAHSSGDEPSPDTSTEKTDSPEHPSSPRAHPEHPIPPRALPEHPSPPRARDPLPTYNERSGSRDLNSSLQLRNRSEDTFSPPAAESGQESTRTPQREEGIVNNGKKPRKLRGSETRRPEAVDVKSKSPNSLSNTDGKYTGYCDFGSSAGAALGAEIVGEISENVGISISKILGATVFITGVLASAAVMYDPSLLPESWRGQLSSSALAQEGRVVILLLVSSNAENLADSFSKALHDVFSRVVSSEKLLPFEKCIVSGTVSEPRAREKAEDILRRQRFILLQDLERIRDPGYQGLLMDLADTEDARMRPDGFIILRLGLKGEPSYKLTSASSTKDYQHVVNAIVQTRLRELWKGVFEEGKIDPLLARIANRVLLISSSTAPQ